MRSYVFKMTDKWQINSLTISLINNGMVVKYDLNENSKINLVFPRWIYYWKYSLGLIERSILISMIKNFILTKQINEKMKMILNLNFVFDLQNCCVNKIKYRCISFKPLTQAQIQIVSNQNRRNNGLDKHK